MDLDITSNNRFDINKLSGKNQRSNYESTDKKLRSKHEQTRNQWPYNHSSTFWPITFHRHPRNRVQKKRINSQRLITYALRTPSHLLHHKINLLRCFVWTFVGSNVALSSNELRTTFPSMSNRTGIVKEQLVNWICFVHQHRAIFLINWEPKRTNWHNVYRNFQVISNVTQTNMEQCSVLRQAHFDLSTIQLQTRATISEPTSNCIRSYLRSPALTPPRTNNQLTEQYRLTDHRKNTNQMTTAPTYPSTNTDLSSIAGRWFFKLDSDYLLTEFDLITHRLRTGSCLRTTIEKRQTWFEKATNELQMDSEQTSTTIRTIFDLTST